MLLSLSNKRRSVLALALAGAGVSAGNQSASAGPIWDGGGGASNGWNTSANWNGDTLPPFDGTDNIVFQTIGTGGTTTLLNANRNIASFTSEATTGFTVSTGTFSGATLTLSNGTLTRTAATQLNSTTAANVQIFAGLLLGADGFFRNLANTDTSASGANTGVQGGITFNAPVSSSGAAKNLVLAGDGIARPFTNSMGLFFIGSTSGNIGGTNASTSTIASLTVQDGAAVTQTSNSTSNQSYNDNMPIILRNGLFILRGSSSAVAETIFDTHFSQAGFLTLRSSGGTASQTLTFKSTAANSLDRVSGTRGTLEIGSLGTTTSNGTGTLNLNNSTSAPGAVTTTAATLIAPYIVATNNAVAGGTEASFVRLNANSVVNALYSGTINDSGGTSIVDVNANATSTGGNILALRIRGVGAADSTLSGSGTTTIGSGGVIFAASGTGRGRINSNLNFTSEALVFVTGTNIAAGAIGGSISGSNGLTKFGGGILDLSNAANAYSGLTSVNNGILRVSAGNGINSTPLAVYQYGTFDLRVSTTAAGLDGNGRVTTLDVGAKNFTLSKSTGTSTFTGLIDNGSGSLNLVKSGNGTQILGGTNSYTGTTTITGGTLNVTTTLASNSASSIFIAADADGTFGTTDDAKLIRNTALNASYANYGSTEVGGLATAAQIVRGANFTQNPNGESITMQWRPRAANETPGSQTYPPSDPASFGLISDVISLTGMANSNASSQTDAFALQMTYVDSGFAPTGVNSEASAAARGDIRLDWLDPNGAGTGIAQWENAILGNFGAGSTVLTNVQSSWSAFQTANSITDANLATFLGSWGVDPSTNTVWAVLNHNSSFAVVPEPATAMVLPLASAAVLMRRRRKLQK